MRRGFMGWAMTDNRAAEGGLILLHPADNVLICAANLAAGTRVDIDGVAVVMPGDVMLGHKVARRALAAGEKVLRYGIAIGTMTHDVAPGAHVHRHNLASDYIPSHDRAVLRATGAGA